MDISYLLFLQNMREAVGGIFDSLMLLVTALGEAPVAFLLMGAVYWCLDKKSGQFMCLNVAFGCALNQFLKALVQVDRPWVRDERVHPVEEALAGAPGYSFPSGHTHRATAVWGALGVSLWKRKEKAAAAICWITLAMIGFSRNYLGVHSPQDVVTAWVTGILLIFILNKVTEWTNKEANRDIYVAAAGCAVILLMVLIAGRFSYAGAGIGFLIGWVVERHFICFDIEEKWTDKCVRFAIGGAGIWYLLKVFQSTLKLCMEKGVAELISLFLTAVFITAVYPFFFCKKERHKAGIIVMLLAIAANIALAAIVR